MARVMMSDRTGIYRLRDGEQMCFVHIPKTAGTTMSAILESRFDHHRICPTPYWRNLRVMSQEDMKNYQLFRGHFPYDVADLIPGKPVCITMVRDPIERVISAYEFMKTCIIVYPAARKVQEKARTLSLKDYVRDPEVNGVVNAQTRMIAGREAQSSKIAQQDPVWLEMAQENLQHFAFVGVTERFWDSMGLLSYQFGWTPPGEIQRLMVGKKKLRRENLSQDVIDVLTEYNQLDIEFYNYAKTLFEQQYDQMCHQLRLAYGSECGSEKQGSGIEGAETEGASRNRVVLNTARPGSSSAENHDERVPSDEPGIHAADREDGTDSRDTGNDMDSAQAQAVEVRSLLERHYEACFADERQDAGPTDRLTYTFDQAVPGNGWHRLEGIDREEPFRWTGPRTESTLDFPLDLRHDLALEFRILNSTTPEVLQSLQVTANHHPLKLVPLHRDVSGAMFRCTIPKSVADLSKPFTRLAFKINKTIPFHTVSLGSDDKRPVGLAMSLVQCFPLDSRPDVEMIESPIDSEPWFEAIAFLKEHIQPEERLFAPNTFRLVFPNHIPYEGFDNIDLTINYVAKTLAYRVFDGDNSKPGPSKDRPARNKTSKSRIYDWVIIHKGVNDDYVGWILFQILRYGLKPVFANSVFVIFAKTSSLTSLGYRSTDVRPAFAGYLKHQVNQLSDKRTYRRSARGLLQKLKNIRKQIDSSA